MRKFPVLHRAHGRQDLRPMKQLLTIVIITNLRAISAYSLIIQIV
jgi:hypothetical protein